MSRKKEVDIKKKQLLYRRSKMGLIAGIYNSQKRKSRERLHPEPNYNLQQLRDWALSHPKFHILYNLWVESNYQRQLKPSFDRLDNFKPYTFDNIQIVTWKDNDDNAHRDMRNGIIKVGSESKSVVQLSLDNKIIDTYHSINEAGRRTGIYRKSIARVCNKLHNAKTAGGYKWKFETQLHENDDRITIVLSDIKKYENKLNILYNLLEISIISKNENIIQIKLDVDNEIKYYTGKFIKNLKYFYEKRISILKNELLKL